MLREIDVLKSNSALDKRYGFQIVLHCSIGLGYASPQVNAVTQGNNPSYQSVGGIGQEAGRP